MFIFVYLFVSFLFLLGYLHFVFIRLLFVSVCLCSSFCCCNCLLHLFIFYSRLLYFFFFIPHRHLVCIPQHTPECMQQRGLKTQQQQQQLQHKSSPYLYLCKYPNSLLLFKYYSLSLCLFLLPPYYKYL